MEQSSEIRLTPVQQAFATEKIGKLIMRFSVPCVIAMLVNSLYNIVDQIFIGQGVGFLGNAATNVSFPLVTLSLAISLLIGNGCASRFSLMLGSGRHEDAARTVGNALLLSTIAGVVLFLIGFIFLEPLLWLFGATEANIGFAMDYARIIVFGFPFVVVSLGLNSVIRADGSPRYSMTSMLVGAVLNTILDPLFIFTFDMGVEGAAIATIIGQMANCALNLFYLKKFVNIKFSWPLLKPKLKICTGIFTLGMSSFVTQMALFVVQIVMNNSLTYYGALSSFGSDIPLAALGIVMKVNQILMAFLIGISTGIQPIVGFNYGAKNYDRVKKTYLIAVILATICSTAAWAVFFFCPQLIIPLFGQENNLYNEFAEKCFRMFLMCVFLAGFQVISSNFFQAIGKPLRSTVLSLSRQILFLVPLMLLLPMAFGLDGTLYSGPLSDLLSTVLTFIFVAIEMKHLNRQHAAETQKSKGTREAVCHEP